MKIASVLQIVSSCLSFSQEIYQQDVFRLLCGKDVDISRYIGDETTIPADPTNTYGATKIGNASYFYNCFTYAFMVHNNENVFSESDLFNIDNIKQFFYGNNCFGTPLFSGYTIDRTVNNLSIGDLIFYKLDNDDPLSIGNYCYSHVGIVSEVGTTLSTTKIISKWGKYGIYEGYLNQNGYYHDGQLPEYYDLTTFVCYRPIHNYSAVGSISSVNQLKHKKICQYCNQTVIENHNFVLSGNRLVCSTCGYQGLIIYAPSM